MHNVRSIGIPLPTQQQTEIGRQHAHALATAIVHEDAAALSAALSATLTYMHEPIAAVSYQATRVAGARAAAVVLKLLNVVRALSILAAGRDLDALLDIDTSRDTRMAEDLDILLSILTDGIAADGS